MARYKRTQGGKFRKVKGGMKKRGRVSKPLKAAINRIVKGNIETKYVAQTIMLNQPLVYECGLFPNNRLRNLIPAITQGMDSYQRIGDKIKPVRMRVHVHYSWDATFVGSSPPVIRQFHVTSKAVKSHEQWTPAVAGSATLRLLDGGQGIPERPSGDGAGNICGQTFMKPVNKDDFTPHKGCRTFIMQKNSGDWVQDTKSPNTDAPSSYSSSQLTQEHGFSVKLPKTLNYDSSLGDYPVNALPLFAAHWSYPNELLISNTDPYSPTTGLPNTNKVHVTVRTELWYKDA